MAITRFTTRKYAGNGRIVEMTDTQRKSYASYISGDKDEALRNIEAKVGTDDENVYVIEYEGAVLAEWEVNMHDDSDFQASVWNAETQAIEVITWGTTRGWTYFNNCVVDATPEVIEQASAVRNAQLSELAAARANRMELVPSVDAKVTIEGGRKHKGKAGQVFWYGVDRFNSSRWLTAYRVGVKTEDGEKFFVPADYAKVVDPKTFTAADFPMTGTPGFNRPGEVAMAMLRD